MHWIIIQRDVLLKHELNTKNFYRLLLVVLVSGVGLLPGSVTRRGDGGPASKARTEQGLEQGGGDTAKGVRHI